VITLVGASGGLGPLTALPYRCAGPRPPSRRPGPPGGALARLDRVTAAAARRGVTAPTTGAGPVLASPVLARLSDVFEVFCLQTGPAAPTGRQRTSGVGWNAEIGEEVR